MAKRVLTCPNCARKLTAPEGAPRFRCPHCKTILTAPSGAEAPPPAAAPQAPGPKPAAPQPAPAPPQPVAPPRPRLQAAAPSAGDGLPIGQSLVGYTVTRCIGSGSMGTVYEAIQEGLKRRVALKVLPQSVANDAAFLTSFKREAQAVAKLNHPNIVQIFDILEEHGHHFFSMEYVDGESLSDRLKRERRVSLPDAMDIVAQVASALEHAYEHMLIHRDIKPSNVLLTERGEAKLADLGLSKSLEETAVGIARGTHGGPVYMAPEFVRNSQLADCRSDIYALGAMLFHLLTGRPPFLGPSTADLIRQHAQEPFPSAKALAPEIPAAVDELLAQMCAKDPAERFQTHGELLAHIRALLKTTAVRMPRVLDAKPVQTRRRRSNALPWVLGGAAILVLAAIAGGLIVLLPSLRGTRQQATAPATATEAVPSPAPTTPDQVAAVPPPDEPAPDTAAAVAEPPDATETQEPPAKADDEPEPPDEPAAEPDPDEAQPPAADDWEAQLDAARKNITALVGEGQYGKALEILDGLTENNESLALKAAVEEARQLVTKEAKAVFTRVVQNAAALAKAGKIDEARAALQKVADTFGAAEQATQAKAGIAALDAYTESLTALAEAETKVAKSVETATARAEKQAAFGRAIEPIEALLKDWKLDEAAEALGKLTFADEAVDAQIAQRKTAVDGLIALLDHMADAIGKAEPKLRKSTLHIRGFNGDLVKADRTGITTETMMGATKKVDKLEWLKLRDVSIEALAKHAAKAGRTSDQLGLALWLRLIGSTEKAQARLTRAAALGAETDALTDPAETAETAEREAQAAQALAAAIRLVLKGDAAKGAAALDDYKEKFRDTEHYSDHEELLDLAVAFQPFAPPGLPEPKPTPDETARVEEPEPDTPEPDKPAPKKPTPDKPAPKKPAPKKPTLKPEEEKKAGELYAKAAEAYKVRRYDECAKLLAELKKKYDGSQALTDAKRKPSAAAMAKTIASRGATLRVSRTARGAHRSLEKALEALKKGSTTILVDGAVYRGTTDMSGQFADNLVLRGLGQRRPRFDGGSKRETILKLPNNGKNLWVDHFDFVQAKTAVVVGRGCAVTFHECTGVMGIERFFDAQDGAKITVRHCALKLDGLSGLKGFQSVLQFGAGAELSNVGLSGCILVGLNMEIRGATLVDCAIIGSATLGEDSELIHVTAAGPLRIPEGARSIVVEDSILRTITIEVPKDKRDRDKAAKITNTVFTHQRKSLPPDMVDTEGVAKASVSFANPRIGDFRLPRSSSLRTKGSEKSELGCRFTPENLAVVSLAKQFPMLLRPSTRPSVPEKRR